MKKIWKLPLWQQMLWAMGLGLIIGVALSPHGGQFVSQNAAHIVGDWLSLPGGIFMTLIKIVVFPLIIASIVLAISENKDMQALKSKGTRIGLYFLCTTICAVIIGISLSYLINPAQYIDPAIMLTSDSLQNRGRMPDFGTTSSLPDMIINLLPENPVLALTENDMLGIVLISLIVGVAMLTLPDERVKPLTDILKSVLDVTMQIVHWAMKIAPLAVFGFLANLAIRMGPESLMAMGAYVGTVILGLLCIVGLYICILIGIAKRNPLTFFKKIRDAQILAFSTSSSAATLPLSLKIAEEDLEIEPETAGFVIPLGTTINMDGTAIYQIIAGLFLASIFGIDLALSQVLLLAVTVIGASIGSPGSPGVGLAILSGMLAHIGISAEGIAIILAVDRILDMCRTSVNVTGDLTAATVMDKWIKHDRYYRNRPV